MKEKKIEGYVISGRGQAASLVTRNSNLLFSMLGKELFPGSLNVVLNEPVIFRIREGNVFDSGRRYIWQARIEGVQDPVYVYRWHGCPLHILEVMSICKLRTELNLRDFDEIKIILDEEVVINSVSTLRKSFWAIFWRYREHWYYSNEIYKRMVYRIKLRIFCSQRMNDM